MRNLFFAFCLALGSASASAANVLVTENQGGGLGSAIALDTAFGAGNYNSINSYGSVNTNSVFSAANSFVFLDGGAGTDTVLSSFLANSAAAILSWVFNGGSLFIQSGGWSESIAFGPATIVWSFSNLNMFGNLTPEGSAAFGAGLSPSYMGFPLGTSAIVGSGLTSFLEGVGMDDGTGGIIGGGSILAGTQYGNGYIMYSGLFDTDPGMGISDAAPVLSNAVAYAAAQGHSGVIPEPISLALLGVALFGAGLAARVKLQRK